MWQFVSKKLSKCQNFLMHALACNAAVYKVVGRKPWTDYNKNPNRFALSRVPAPFFRSEREFAAAAFSCNGYCLAYSSRDVKEDEHMVRIAIRNRPTVAWFAGNPLRNQLVSHSLVLSPNVQLPCDSARSILQNLDKASTQRLAACSRLRGEDQP